MRSDPVSDEASSPPKTLSFGSDRGRLNVFVSYSRKDREFTDQLVAALDAFGFATTIDRKGIHGAENWEGRLGQIILESDTVVFVLTPASAVSPICRWEVDQALELRKRIVPVLASPLGDANPHERLRDLDYIYFYPEPTVPGSGFGSGLARLTVTLSVDIEWTREHTRLGALASHWQAGDRPTDLLLRGSELARLQRWRDARPATAPDLTTLQRAFLQASEDAEIARASDERKQIEDRQRALKQVEDAQEERAKALKRLARRTKYGILGMAALAVLVSLIARFAYSQNQALEGASLRLREGIKLKIAQTDHAVIATERWYRIATDYKLAIGISSAQPSASVNQGEFGGTGFLVKGGSLRAEWANQVIFLTGFGNITGFEQDKPDISRARIMFPGIDRVTQLRFEKILFKSEDLGVAVLTLADRLPPNTIPVDLASQIKSKNVLDGVAVLHWTAQDGFSLGFGHSITRPSGIETREDRMYYTYVTGPGASGAPVFDVSSGNVVCLHVGSYAFLPRPVGWCTSISKIVAAITAR